MVVVGDLAHVVVEEPALRVLLVGEASEVLLHDAPFVVARRRPMGTEHDHRHVARIAVEKGEWEWVRHLTVPRRRPRQLA